MMECGTLTFLPMSICVPRQGPLPTQKAVLLPADQSGEAGAGGRGRGITPPSSQRKKLPYFQRWESQAREDSVQTDFIKFPLLFNLPRCLFLCCDFFSLPNLVYVQ